MMTNLQTTYSNRFGLAERKVKYGTSYAAGVMMEGGKNLDARLDAAIFALYEACTDEWTPMFRSDARYERNFGRTKDRDLRRQMFEADLEDSAKLFLFGSKESGLVAYLMMSEGHHVLSLYVMPQYRKDRVAMSLLELYLNRFDAPLITASPWALDYNAIDFFKRLGFTRVPNNSHFPVVAVNPTTEELVFKAK